MGANLLNFELLTSLSEINAHSTTVAIANTLYAGKVQNLISGLLSDRKGVSCHLTDGLILINLASLCQGIRCLEHSQVAQG